MQGVNRLKKSRTPYLIFFFKSRKKIKAIQKIKRKSKNS